MSKISLDELIALNDEIRGLIRAGIPLDQGLRVLGNDLPGRLGNFARSLSEGLERGQSLVDVVDQSTYGIPQLYRGVVAAGLKSGRLAAALEGISRITRQASELRHAVILSMIYPTVLIYVATGLFSFVGLKTAPVLAKTYEQFGFAMPSWYAHVQPRLNDFAPLVLLGLWLALALGIGIWFFWSRRATAHYPSRATLFSFAQVKYLGRMATFTNVLSLLIEHDVPLDEALVLATKSSGDQGLRLAGELLASQAQRGARVTSWPKHFPPLLAWQITTARSGSQLAKNLRQIADSYYHRAQRMGEWVTVYLPILLAAGVGGAIALSFALVVIAPFYHLLFLLSRP